MIPSKRGVVAAPAPEAVLVGDLVTLAAGPLEQHLAVVAGQILPGDVDVDPVVLADRFDEPPVVHRRRPHPGRERALGDREGRVGDAELRIDDALEAEAVAALAGSMRAS